MELEADEDRHVTERTDAEQNASVPAKTTPYLPFASEGLEQLRDTHC